MRVVSSLAFVLLLRSAIAADTVDLASLDRVTFRYDSLLHRILAIPAPIWTLSKSTTPASRSQLIDSIYRFYSSANGHVEMTPLPKQISPNVVYNGLDPEHQNRLKTLLKLGYVAPVGPLATRSNGSLNPEEVGDALAFGVIRALELCHIPDREFSPYLKAPGF